MSDSNNDKFLETHDPEDKNLYVLSAILSLLFLSAVVATNYILPANNGVKKTEFCKVIKELAVDGKDRPVSDKYCGIKKDAASGE